MAANNKEFEIHSFKSFLTRYHVIIPMVQRDYAQGRTSDDANRVRSRFLESIYGYLSQDGSSNVMKLDFIYGEKEDIWSKTIAGKLERINITPLDGQQRLTTLYLLHWYAAKKAQIPIGEYSFLNNFSYNIRPSSRDFCNHLLTFEPDLSRSISEQLTDMHWFMGNWNDDPTVNSMLVMLDAIREKFSDLDNLWEKLTGQPERIIFYFLPLSENGLSDELYIKMNSRGKKLTPFEHFKAEFEDLYERDSAEAISVSHKFDVEWADTLFPYRDEKNLIDKEFLRYFFYVSHILCYQQGIEKSRDEFQLIKSLYKDSLKANENRKYLERAFDCWHDVMIEYKGIDNFFSSFLSQNAHEDSKVSTYKYLWEYREKKQNFFHACIKLYQVNNNFSYGDFLFLYGILTYLLNRDKVNEEDFRTRLRILRNLIWNSNSGEIRGDAEYMHDLMSEVSTLIIEGRIDKTLSHRFNGIQEDEEIAKAELKSTLDSDSLNLLLKYEDHPLIYGYVNGLGTNHLELVDTFYNVFTLNAAPDDYFKIHCAMISVGSYLQYDNNRYYLGNGNRSTWTGLLHKSNKGGFEMTMDVLRELLTKVKEGETLDSIINQYTSSQESTSSYPWRYYFAKYPDMVRGADGEFTWDENNDYVCTSLNKHQYNGKHWNPFLNVLNDRLSGPLKEKYKCKIISLGDYGEDLSLLHPISSLKSVGNGFTYFEQGRNEPWIIKQTEDGIDTEDRIQFAIGKIKDLVDVSINAETGEIENTTQL